MVLIYTSLGSLFTSRNCSFYLNYLIWVIELFIASFIICFTVHGISSDDCSFFSHIDNCAFSFIFVGKLGLNIIDFTNFFQIKSIWFCRFSVLFSYFQFYWFLCCFIISFLLLACGLNFSPFSNSLA